MNYCCTAPQVLKLTISQAKCRIAKFAVPIPFQLRIYSRAVEILKPLLLSIILEEKMGKLRVEKMNKEMDEN